MATRIRETMDFLPRADQALYAADLAGATGSSHSDLIASSPLLLYQRHFHKATAFLLGY